MAHVFHGDPRHLDRPARRKKLPALQILQEMGIKAGDTVLDFGAGIGYFSRPALDLVGPAGTVIAIDCSPRMLAELRRRVGQRPNLILCEGSDLGSWTADVILLVTVLHELDDPAVFLNSCFSHLRSGGRVVIIDWQKKRMLDGPPMHERIAKDDLLRMTSRSYRDHPIHKAFYFLEFW